MLRIGLEARYEARSAALWLLLEARDVPFFAQFNRLVASEITEHHESWCQPLLEIA
jgi:hypothetical protein